MYCDYCHYFDYFDCCYDGCVCICLICPTTVTSLHLQNLPLYLLFVLILKLLFCFFCILFLLCFISVVKFLSNTNKWITIINKTKFAILCNPSHCIVNCCFCLFLLFVFNWQIKISQYKHNFKY